MRPILSTVPKLTLFCKSDRTRSQAVVELAKKPEQHKEMITAKQAENEAQRAKIRAWKNGTFAMFPGKGFMDTPPASQGGGGGGGA